MRKEKADKEAADKAAAGVFRVYAVQQVSWVSMLAACQSNLSLFT